MRVTLARDSHARARRLQPSAVSVYAVLLAGAVPLLYPFLWMLASSVRTLEEIAVAGVNLWPAQWHWDNYAAVFSTFPFWQYLRNSVLTTALPILGTVFSSSLVGFAFARILAPGKNILFMVLLGTMLLPGEVLIIPQFILFRNLGMIDTLYPLILPSFFGSAFFIFLLRQFYARLPVALEEAAIVDGCGTFRTWWRIFVPLSKPALLAVAVLVFMGRWNDFFGPVIYINSDTWKTLPLALAGFSSTYATQTNLLMAATAVIIAPCIVLFFLSQRAFMEGLTFTGSKES